MKELQKVLDEYDANEKQLMEEAKIFLILKFGSLLDAYTYWISAPHDSKIHRFNLNEARVLGAWNRARFSNNGRTG